MLLSILIGAVLRQQGQPTGPTESKTSRVHIGFSMDTLQETRWARDRDAFVARANELGAEVTVLSANSDDNRQMTDIESLITSAVDVIVIVPHDGTAMAKAVRVAHQANIPVVAYDRLIRDCNLDLYVTFENERIGELQGAYLVEVLGQATQPAKIVRIYGSKTDNNAFVVKAGQDKALAPAIADGSIEVIHEDWADEWKPENAKRIMNAAITKYGNTIDAVLTSNDGTAGGAIQALREEGLAGSIYVTGQDADLVACQRIARDEQSMTVFKSIKKLAGTAAEAAVALAQGRPIIAKHGTFNGKIEVPSILDEVVTVTKANLDETVIAAGFHSRDAVYQD